MDNLKLKNNDAIILFDNSVVFALNETYAAHDGNLVGIASISSDIKQVLRKGIVLYERLEKSDELAKNKEYSRRINRDIGNKSKMLATMFGTM